MLYAAAVEHDIALSASYMVGDRWRDVGAGRNAGCATILVLSDRAEPTTVTPDSVASDLSHAATLILSRL
jgi:D-glycero-D-manno-heptose 1,7-bisphosphate phosphatase